MTTPNHRQASGSMRNPAALIELRDVGFSYPALDGRAPLEVLRHVALEIHPAQLFVVAGRSGSGKSTLLNVAAGLLRPTAGQVRWQGEAIATLPREVLATRRLARVGMVFQNGGLIESLTAVENVALAAIPRGLRSGARERAVILLRDRDLGDRLDHLPAQLSGGEQQRVALARALFSDPPVLIVDEPTANLDRRSADAIVQQLVDLAGRGSGLLVASHDPALMAAATDLFELEPKGSGAQVSGGGVRGTTLRHPWASGTDS
jgi:ABC-type lipoprotein export system ATPase subunit